MQIINPATSELIREITEDNRDTLSAKFQLLKNAQSGWSALEIKQRVKILQNFSIRLENQIEMLAAVLTSEIGKPLQQSRNEINGAGTRIQWLTENAEKYLGENIYMKNAHPKWYRASWKWEVRIRCM
jgi:acyl-CoA reductase-like NAD-dependent aldehyde dehydrogenase